jgi:ribosomal protein S18 acetylase RimI-like enzyme
VTVRTDIVDSVGAAGETARYAPPAATATPRTTVTGKVSTRRQLGTALGSTAWIRPAAFDPHVVYLRLTDDSLVPAPDEVETWTHRLVDDGRYRKVRTAALFPRAAERFCAAGYEVVDTLALLRADLDERVIERHSPAAADDRATATIRADEYEAAARVDLAAFGRNWSHDADELRDIRHATPACQVRVRARRTGGWRRGRFGVPTVAREIEAFAIAGASPEHGYLQRLSVDPQAQRRGHGRALTLDAMHWMAGRRLRDCLVNTSVDNVAALALYESTGFRQLPDRLQVLEFELGGGGS